jgi:hypothetical protein
MNDTNKLFSLADLDATRASGEGFEFEYLDADGNGTGIFFKVLGGQSEAVTREVNALINARRQKEAAREIARRNVLGGKRAAEFEPLENDIDFGQRLAAVRLIGWRGISEPFTPENALTLCRTNKQVAEQIVTASDNLANFMIL